MVNRNLRKTKFQCWSGKVAWVYIKTFFNLEANQPLKIPKFPEVSLSPHVYQKVKSFHLLTKFWCWNIITIKCTSWFRKQGWNCEIHCQIYGILKKYKCSYPHLQIFVRHIWTELSIGLQIYEHLQKLIDMSNIAKEIANKNGRHVRSLMAKCIKI